MAEKQRRRKRNQRLENPDPVQIRPRDLDILIDLYRHGALTLKQIEYMYFGSSTRTQWRMEKLYDNALVDRVFMQVISQPKGSQPFFYVVDRKGIDELWEKRHIDLTWHYSYKDLSDNYLKHAKLLNDVVAAFIRACRDNGYEVRDERTEKELKAQNDRVRIRRVSGNRKAIPFRPDYYLTFVADRIRRAFFIEADRGTEKGSVIKEKIRAYDTYLKSRAYAKAYNRDAGFRVLFVTTGVKRLEYLKQWAKEENANPNFWFAQIDEISRSTIMNEPVWFVPAYGKRQSIIRPE